MPEKQLANNLFFWGTDSNGNALIGGVPGYGPFTQAEREKNARIADEFEERHNKSRKKTKKD